MKNKKHISRLLYFLLLAVVLTVFLLSGYYVLRYVTESRKQDARYDDLAAIMEQESAMAETATGLEETSPAGEALPQSNLPTVLPAYLKLHKMNGDMVGWIKIDGTDISYPVMQHPAEKDYYLHRNFDREHSDHGCIYVREECDVRKPSDNVVIYGHRMKDGSMFEGLSRFEQQSFWEEYPEIRFDTIWEEHTYKVFAVFKTSASKGRGFEYHTFLDADTQADFDWFVSKCKSLAFYETGITPQYGDKLITLSTCEYTQHNGRLVVVAVRTK